jgi:putative colanic acid biosynthesis acetyltransferase WcaF
LREFDNSGFRRERGPFFEALWLLTQMLFVSCGIPGSRHRVWLLRLFGARIGCGVVVKPGVRVKFPWKLRIGNNTWVGESVWIDNLANVEVGSDCCLSQGAYLCTGSHDWTAPHFDLLIGEIRIADGAWVAAQVVLGPGTTMGRNSVVTLGSIASGELKADGVYGGNPATWKKQRDVKAR